METKWTQMSALALSCLVTSESRAAAHPELVGLAGVRETEFCETKPSGHWQQQANGGVRIAQPRITDPTLNVQQSLGAYGNPIFGASVFAAKGSLMASPIAPAMETASGVPPRGRPV